MMGYIYGYYNGEHFVPSNRVKLTKNQKVLITLVNGADFPDLSNLNESDKKLLLII